MLIAQQCDAQLVTDPEAGIDYSRVVHGEQKFVHHRPLTAGDDVVGVLHVDAVREAGGHAMVTTRTELARSRASRSARPRRPSSSGEASDGRAIRTAGRASTPVDDAAAATIHVDRATLVQYAGASLDRNRIHWDERFAKQVGLPDVIAHGMFTMGSAVTVVTDWVGDAGRVVEYGTRFTKPVVVPYEGGADIEVERRRQGRRPRDEAGHRRADRDERRREGPRPGRSPSSVLD